MILLLVALLAAAIPTAHASAPDNYCTTVTVDAVTAGYDVSATGAGRYARIRDLTTSTTVIATDFGSGATAYTWTSVALDVTHNYQVQVSHTSLTTGFSTDNCLFTPPPPLGVVFGSFAATVEGVNVRLKWGTTTEMGNLGFDLFRAPCETCLNTYLGFFPSPVPGGTTMGAEYEYLDTDLLPGEWWYWVEDVDQGGYRSTHEPVMATVLPPTAVTLASFEAAGGTCSWKTTPRLRCQCGDNMYASWDKCLRRTR